MKSPVIIPTFVLWKWMQPGYRTAFLPDYVNAVVWQLKKFGVPQDKIVCVTDDPGGINCRTFPLWNDLKDIRNISGSQLPSCYRRLRLFDRATQEAMQIPKDELLVSFDIDACIMQDFLALFQMHPDKDFVGWRVPGMRHRIVYNGSMWMFRAGSKMQWVWDEFNPARSPTEALMAGYMGSDQGYLSHRLVCLQKSGGWNAAEHGVLSYHRDVVKMRLLPRHGRVVFFPGKNKPWLPFVQKQSSWIMRYWPKPEQLVPTEPTNKEVAA